MAYSVVVALDGSPCSEAAALTARRLAGLAPDLVRLHAVHVVNVSHFRGDWVQGLAGLLGWEPVLVPEQVEAAFRQRGEQLLRDFQQECHDQGLELRTSLVQGAVAPELVHLSSQADLLIVGLRGQTDLEYPGRGGGTLATVLRQCSTSVLLVGRNPLRFQRVLLGYDGSDGSGAALRTVRRLAALTRCPVSVCFVPDPRRPADHDPTPEALRALREDGVQAGQVQAAGEPHEALANAAVEAGADVLALGFRGRSLLKDLLLGRVTERLLHTVELGLLVAR